MVDVLAAIAATADDLTEPHQHREPLTRHDHNRNKKTVGWHITVQPGLLTQLAQSVTPAAGTVEGSLGGGYSSRPPLALEALSRHLAIIVAVMDWCAHLGILIRASPESNLRALVGAAGSLDPDDARALLADLRRWRGWCAVLTGWEKLHQPANVTCPVVDCAQANTLRINLTNGTAMCRACGSTWTEADGSLAVLADHIRATTNAA